jgi:hypothetical protein
MEPLMEQVRAAIASRFQGLEPEPEPARMV